MMNMNNTKIIFKIILLMHQTKVIMLLAVLLLALAIGNEYAAYNIGLITGDYYEIMNNKDRNGFIRQTIKSVFIILGNRNLLSF